MKRIISFTLALLMLLLLAGCNAGMPGDTTANATTAATNQETTEATEPTEPIDYEALYCPDWNYDVAEQAKSDGKLHYYFMSNEGIVRQVSYSDASTMKWGDSCLVVFPTGQTMLVDSGTYWYAPVLIGNLKQMGVEKLDYLMITHPHADHYGGAFGVQTKTTTFLDEIKVGKVYYRAAKDPANEFESTLVQKVCAEKNIPAEFLEKGAVLQFGDVKLSVLWPNVGTSETIVSGTASINNASIVMRFDYGEHSALFTGDLYEAGELLCITSNSADMLDVDLLKVPHHGHKTSSSDLLLSATSPELAVAEGSLNISNLVRDRFAAYEIPLMYNYINGYIHISVGTDGEMDVTSTRNDIPDAVVEEEAIGD